MKSSNITTLPTNNLNQYENDFKEKNIKDLRKKKDSKDLNFKEVFENEMNKYE